MKNIKLNALTNMLVRILNIVFPLITGPYISRVLSKEDFGNFNVANTILNLFIPFATLGIYNYGPVIRGKTIFSIRTSIFVNAFSLIFFHIKPLLLFFFHYFPQSKIMMRNLLFNWRELHIITVV